MNKKLIGALMLTINLALLASCNVKNGESATQSTISSSNIGDSSVVESQTEQIDYTNMRLTYKETFDSSNVLTLLDTKNEYINIKGFSSSDEHNMSSTYSYKWTNQSVNKSINLSSLLPDSVTDLSKYENLYIDIYSPKRTNSEFLFALFTEPYPTTYTYYSYKLMVDFTGYKRIIIPFSNLSASRNPDISMVTNINLYTTGWSMTPNDDTVLYIDKIFFSNPVYEFNIPEDKINNNDYRNITDNIRRIAINNDTENKQINNRLKYSSNSSKKLMNELNRTGLPFEANMVNSSGMSSVFSKIYNMSLAYLIETSELYHSKELLDSIKLAMNYMYENYYLKRGSVFKSGFDNWWDWEIGSAQTIVNILCVIEDGLTASELSYYLEPINKYDPYPNMTMANRVDIGYVSIIASSLEHNYKRLAISVEMLRECFTNVELGDGFYDDGSFIQHTYYGYIGGYGQSLITALSKITYALNNTCYRLDDEMINSQYDWLIESYLPLTYDGTYHDMVRGRGITRNTVGPTLGRSLFEAMVLMTTYLKNENDANYIKGIVKDWYTINTTNYTSSCNLLTLSLINAINDDSNITLQKLNDFAYVYSRQDKSVSLVNGVGIGISMSSTRTGKYESINNENKNGWYTGDGMTYVYLSNTDYANSYWTYVNRYRLPGTTVTTSPREELGLSGKNALAACDFVGGVYNKTNSVSAMQLESASPSNNFNSTLKANKGYFLFGDKLVCLGNTISCSDEYDTLTIIENRKLTGNLYFGDEIITNKSGKVTSSYIYIENYGGIYVNDITNLYYDITDDGFVEIYFNHGKNIADAKYSYILMPNIAKDDLKKEANKFNIIANTSKASAVSYNGIEEYIAWEETTINSITFNTPMILLVDSDSISATDPTMKLSKVEVIYNNTKYTFEVENGYTVHLKR